MNGGFLPSCLPAFFSGPLQPCLTRLGRQVILTGLKLRELAVILELALPSHWHARFAHDLTDKALGSIWSFHLNSMIQLSLSGSPAVKEFKVTAGMGLIELQPAPK